MRIDGGIDQLFARYSEHVFKQRGSNESSVARSWRLLGQSFVTSVLEMNLFVLMWNFLPLRLMLLLISSPFRLLSERSRESRQHANQLENYRPPELGEPVRGQFLSGSVPSVVEDTTINLKITKSSNKKTTPITDKLE